MPRMSPAQKEYIEQLAREIAPAMQEFAKAQSEYRFSLQEVWDGLIVAAKKSQKEIDMSKDVNEEAYCYLIVSWCPRAGRWGPLQVGDRPAAFTTLREATEALECESVYHPKRTERCQIICIPMPPPPEEETLP